VPANVTVNVTASDPDGAVSKVQFFIGSTMIGEDTSVPYSLNVTVETAPTSGLRFVARAVDNLGGEADSAPVDINFGPVNPPPIVISTQPQGQTVQEGGSVTFTVAATGGRGTLTYKWQRNGVDLGVTSPTLQLSNLALGAAGDYRAVVSDGVDSVNSAVATLTVTPRSGGSDVRLAGEIRQGLMRITATGGVVF
jgi:hypothetical protein